MSRRTARSPVALLSLASLALGCASASPAPPPDHAGLDSDDAWLEDAVWAKADGSYAAYGEFERAERACGGPEESLPAVSAGPEPRRAWTACMRTHGWARVRIP